MGVLNGCRGADGRALPVGHYFLQHAGPAPRRYLTGAARRVCQPQRIYAWMSLRGVRFKFGRDRDRRKA